MMRSCYRFEAWTLDCGRCTLTSANGDVSLRPKSFEVLRFLIANAGRVVSRDEILEAAWNGLSVSEEVLTQCVSEVRQALGDSGQRVVKTVPKRGYIFAVPVTEDDADAVADVDVPPIERHQPEGPAVAVMPFANLSGDASQDYFSDGFTEDIINGLSYFSELLVIARNSSFTYKDQAIDVRDVGRQLGAQYIVEGSVRRFGDRIRITAQLVDTPSGVRRWGQRFDRALGDVFAIQDEITQSIVRTVFAHVSKAEIERVARKPPNSWTAYDLTLQGDHAQRLSEQTWDPNYLYEARRLYSEAQNADPDNPRICAKLGHTYVRAYADPASRDFTDLGELCRGLELARRAVGLDPVLPLARAQLGFAYFWMQQLDFAVSEFEKAVALNPNYADYRYPATLVYAGEPLRALDVLQAHVRLDPFHPPQLHAIKGHALYMLKRYADSAASLRECIDRGPQIMFGHAWLAATLVRLDKQAEARAIVADVLKQLPGLTLGRWPICKLYRKSRDADHMNDALREAGFPD